MIVSLVPSNYTRITYWNNRFIVLKGDCNFAHAVTKTEVTVCLCYLRDVEDLQGVYGLDLLLSVE